MQAYKLNFELVPDGCWKSNLRTLLPKGVWDTIRRKVYEKSGMKCEICGVSTKAPEAHEQWEYDEENRVQRLKGVIAVCKPCHAVIHINRTFLSGDEVAASEHFMKVNRCGYAEYRKAMAKANEDHRRRNALGEWMLDVGWIDGFLNE